MHRRLGLALATVLFAAALAAASAPGLSVTARPSNGCPLPCSGQTTSPAGARLLFVQPRGARGPLLAYDTETGRRAFSLPAGVASADGRWHLTATSRLGRTSIVRYDVRTGRPVKRSSLRGRWSLAGVSLLGRWVALSGASSSPARTTVALVDAVSGRVSRTLRLRGDFEVETVSVDGRRLFLIEHLEGSGAPRYLVRLFDLSRGALRSRPLRGRGQPSVMAGLAWSGIASPDGRWLLTLYLNTRRSSAFVHALDLERSSPRCIDLPSGRGALGELERYVLTLSPNGRTLYAANATLGALVEIDLRTRRVTRTVRFAPGPRSAGIAGPTLSGTISRDGGTLYFSDGRDLWAYDAAPGRVRGPYRSGGRIAGFGFGLGDRRVHVLRRDGRMLALEASTGRVTGRVTVSVRPSEP